VHISNFRPVKRTEAVVRIFDRIRQVLPARLLLVGDGPDLGAVNRLARELGIWHLVDAVGAQEEVLPLLSISDLFLLPSAQESFGLAALEAMACEVPVVASRVGGLPEVIEDGVSGFLHPPEALDEMAASAVRLLSDRELHARIADAACRRVRKEFCVDRVVPMYERCYADAG
jgi:N-acetyl-alpha-D-glucosaminyl L-malate synthase BshA